MYMFDYLILQSTKMNIGYTFYHIFFSNFFFFKFITVYVKKLVISILYQVKELSNYIYILSYQAATFLMCSTMNLCCTLDYSLFCLCLSFYSAI